MNEKYALASTATGLVLMAIACFLGIINADDDARRTAYFFLFAGLSMGLLAADFIDQIAKRFAVPGRVASDRSKALFMIAVVAITGIWLACHFLK